MSETSSPGDPLHARMFENGNRIAFVTPVDADGRAWWIERFFEPYDLTPEGMGDALTRSADGEKTISYAYIDGVGKAFSVHVEGRFPGAADVWFVERSFELHGNYFNADEMFLPDADAASGRGRQLMGDLIETAARLGVDRIRIQARNIGRYAWLRMGFRPDGGSWRDLRRSLLPEIYRHEATLGADPIARLARMIAIGGPETANVLAALEEPVRSARLYDSHGEPASVPLGKALFLEAASDWDGEFVLSDPEMMRTAREYLARSA